MLVTGQDSSGNYKLWTTIYGDGGDVPAGNWSSLKELTSATSAGDFEYLTPFLVKADTTRLFFIEKYNGIEPYSRLFASHLIPGSKFGDSLWREPLPLNLTGEYGLAMANHGDYLYLSSSSGVYRADLSEQNLNLSADVLSLKTELGESVSKLTVELRNDDGRYASPGTPSLSVLNTGGEIELGTGYITSAGAETGMALTFQLDAFEHTSGGGKASLILHASGGRERLDQWKSHYQFLPGINRRMK